MSSAPSANELLAAFLADSEEAVIGFHLDASVFLWNHAAEALYGYGSTASDLLEAAEKRLYQDKKITPFARITTRPATQPSYVISTPARDGAYVCLCYPV